jgi:hypothetical protein
MGGGIDDVQRGICEAPKGVDGGVARAALLQRMRRIVKTKPGAYTGDSEDDRLVALRDRLRVELTPPPEWVPEHLLTRHFSPPDDETLAAAMVEREIAHIKDVADQEIEAPDPVEPWQSTSSGMDARGLITDWGRQAAQRQRDDYELFLVELGQAREAEHIEGCGRLLRPGPDCPPHEPSRAPMTVDLYDQYIGAPLVATAKQAVAATPVLVSLMLDFVPIIGQIKALAEAIVGRDLITGRELEDWERGLGALLAIIPEAKGIFKAGRTGIRTLATVARDSGQPIDKVYRAAKGASELTEAEVRAAKQLVNGKPANPTAFEKVSGKLDEMLGNKPKRSRVKSSPRIASGVIEDSRGLGRQVAGTIDTTKKLPGKVIPPAKTGPKALAVMRDIDPNSILALEKAGVKISEDAARLLVNKYAGFMNRFYRRPGFDLVIRDLIGPAKRSKGAKLVVAFVEDSANKIDPLTVAFELPSGITKTATRETAARLTDIVVTVNGKSLNYEFKAYSAASVALFAQNPKKIVQLVKDVKILGRESVRWVFDSREVTREFVVKKFKQAIKSDAILAKEFGDGAKLEKALDELIVMYPPVPKPPPIPPLGAAKRPFADRDDE